MAPSIVVEHFHHACPPLAFATGPKRLLHGIADCPPSLHRSVLRHHGGIGGEIAAVIFPVGKEDVLRFAEENRVVADVGSRDGGKDLRSKLSYLSL